MSEKPWVLEELEIPGNIKRILREFINKAKHVLGDVEVYLFGSYARGNWLDDSDLDLIVVSSKFKDLSIAERYRLVRELLPENISAEILTYTPEEFSQAKKKSIILQDASKYWKKLL